MAESTILKLALLLAMILLTILAGLTPIWLLKILRKKAATAQTTRKQNYVSLALCLLTCFSGGVFLATCFLHLFPELSDHLTHMRIQYGFTFDYPLAELLSCMGFFLLFFLEEAVLYLIPSMAHGHSHGGKHGHSHDLNGLFAPTPQDSNHKCDNAEECSQKEHVTNDDASCRLISNTTDQPSTRIIIGDGAVAETSCCKIQTAIGDSSRIQISSTTTCKTSECPVTFLSMEVAEPERCETNCDRVKEDPPILMKSRPHAHSHGTRSVTIVLAIAFHAIIEGLALGVQEDSAKIWAIFISLTVHKLIVAFSVGLQLARTHAHNLHWVVISMIMISLMTPIGGILGMIVQNAPIDGKARDIIILICQGIAVGTFIYVTFFEVLIHERDNEHPNLLKLFMMLLGFTFIGLIRLFADGHSHSHSAGNESDGHQHLHTDHPHDH